MRRFALTIFILSSGLLILALLWDGKKSVSPAGTVRSSGQAAIGGNFEAVDHLGKPFTQKSLLGKYSLIYFGFTYCPDICPTSLLTIAQTLDDLPEALRNEILPVFVTVDPERDTVAVMQQYVSNFHPLLVGVTGSSEQINKVAQAFKIYHAKVPSDTDTKNYLVDHSGYIYLMSKKGDYLAHFPHNVSTQHLADALRSHMLPHK